MIVLDASCVLEVLLLTAEGAQIEEKLFAPSQSVHAPHLIDIEVAHVLRRYTAAGIITAERGRAALDDLTALSISRHSHGPLLDRVWAMRANLSAYDATYVALAEMLDATLLTRDTRIAGAPGHEARVELI